jgi:hydroxyacylglutathione hydrolase
MIMRCLPTGMLSSNCYIIGDGGEGAVIDPGVKSSEIMEVLEAEGLGLKYVILTHVHLDHIISMEHLRRHYGAQVLVHRLDAGALVDPVRNGAGLFGLKTVFSAADICFEHGDVYRVGGQKLEIIHTPGHTPGSVCIKADGSLFTGDTLFRLSIGRTDLEGGNMKDMMDSLTNRLMTLEDEIRVYPGHGMQTTIGYERRNNPYL